jgi:hypothetical protein
VAHTREDGTPCEAHPANADDLVPPATLGLACFAALHDLAAALQAVGGAVEELDAVMTDPALRSVVTDAIEASERAMTVFVASRNLIRDPSGHRTPIAIWALIDRAGQRSRRRPIVAGELATGELSIAVPVVAQALASIITTIDVATEPPSISALETASPTGARQISITVTAADGATPPPAIGATLAITSRAIEAHGGTVTCGATDRPRYTISLPLT